MRTKRGYILIQGKKHFVHDGLNIIGRNKTATVIIPDVSVSHYHSSIVIINDNHYLSDITSSNGTYLKELKLNPLQLYELNNGQNLKVGTVKASYYKLTNNFDATAANEEDQQLTYEENIFDAKTQLYHIADSHKPIQSPNIKNSIEEDVGLSKLDSINDVPTEIFENHNDGGLKLVLNRTEKSLNLDNASGITSTSRDNTLINDLPTQIVDLMNGKIFSICVKSQWKKY
ncbi:hypothetical protein AMK59_3897 [Oryctes borbonicus]|uniref:FHA domain-containing protein n=1 Tax=Oryctes borbonicus TaxID=1629725 RepID=A0A0T6B7W1_9SCAR|nr:hypothetical protein AMK59_3897 [Oryctes borbonicus]